MTLPAATVLVIDDDAISRELLSLQLGAGGFAVSAFADGRSALAYLGSARRAESSLNDWLNDSLNDSPQAILVDRLMPGIAGNALALELRNLCAPSTILLCMSASRPQDSDLRAFDGFLLKPFNTQDFAAALEAATRAVAHRDPAGQGVATGQGVAAEHGDVIEYGDVAGSADPQIACCEPASAVPSAEVPVLGGQDDEQDDGEQDGLDATVFAKLTAAIPALQLRELYQLCLTDAQERIDLMKVYAAKGDRAAYRKEAHTIKGSCAMLGLTHVASLAAAMESENRAVVSVDCANADLKELLVACERARSILSSG